eukprot:3763173-Rhodomonas_salina.1
MQLIDEVILSPKPNRFSRARGSMIQNPTGSGARRSRRPRRAAGAHAHLRRRPARAARQRVPAHPRGLEVHACTRGRPRRELPSQRGP